ncbi:hypothetical protein BH24ACT5_BH24ACT5_16730 [soil metagenome]
MGRRARPGNQGYGRPMRTVLNGPLPAEVDDLLARRHDLGLDMFDEVWNGDYHMNPSPNARHGHVQA